MHFHVGCPIVQVVDVVSLRNFSSVSQKLQDILNKMPKELKHTAALQKQRQKLKEKSQKYIPGTVSLKVLGSGAKGAPRSLYVFTDQSRYLFNCGEGTQRLAHEHKMKLSKLEHIFITHRSWDNIGGLPGVALTIQDVGVPEITIHGPLGTDEIFNATRRFVILRDLAVKMAACSVTKVFEDNVMSVRYIPIEPQKEDSAVLNENSSPDESFEEVDDDVDYYAHERKKKLTFSGGRERKRLCTTKTRSKANGAVMSYVCRLHPRPGALCLERCVDRGVPPGPLLGKLKAGEDVVLQDGTTVKSTDVRLPDDPGPVFVVIECPTVNYLDNLLKTTSFNQYQSSATREEDVADLVVHFTPQSVVEDTRYQTWMERFAPSTQHLTLNETNTCMGSIAVHRIQHKLNLLHSGLFPLLGDKSIKNDEREVTGQLDVRNGEEANSETGTNAIPMAGANDSTCNYRGKTFDSFHLRPRKGWDSTGELVLTPKLFLEEAYESEGFSEALEGLKLKIKETESHISTVPSEPQIVFLGTGSCIPNKTRNTSGILLNISENNSILLDCGEGTYGQIVRFFGPEKSDVIMSRIKAIFVSHLHADHHIGLISLLKARRKALEKIQKSDVVNPVYLIAPMQIMSWLNLYHWLFEPILQELMIIPNTHLDMEECGLTVEVYNQLLKTLNMKDIKTVPVTHCPNAFGIAFTHADQWKLTYSGDTRPCERLVKLGLDSDILIHEATMEDELKEEAFLKLHSTTSQAIQVGRSMKAKFILLTHFSQRYAKIPRINENFSSNVGIAFDNMQVRFSELPLLPLLHSALKIMFAEHYDEMEQKTYRRLMKQERERENQKI